MKKFFSIIVICIYCITPACKKYIDVNQDPNRPVDVQESLILPAVQLAASHDIHAGFGTILSLHYTQAIALNQPVPNHGTYLLVNSELDDQWSDIYSYLNNLKILNEKAEKNENFNYAGIAKILTAYVLGYATDLWGDIPYTEAFKGTAMLTPVYDKQEDIYKTIQSASDAGIADIEKNSVVAPGSDDLFYGGDMEKWQRLAYTLKARYCMHLTKAPGYSAAAQADLALSALENGMQSNDDDWKMSYPGSAGNENPWYTTFLPLSTLILSSHTIETLKNRNDPRLPIMIAPAKNPVSGTFNGRVIGTADIGDLESYSVPGDFYRSSGAYNYLLTYSEALFLKAEALLIKSGVAAAEPAYRDAIISHMQKLGVSSNEINNYLDIRGTLTSQNALQRLMEEKTTASFLSPENFTDWRRTGFPTLEAIPNANISQIPRRVLYPQTERISNPQEQQSARLDGKVWWDN